MFTFLEWEKQIENWKSTTKTKLFLKNPIILNEIGSTNIFLKEHATFPHGTFVIAYQQTQGKGQKNRKWISNPGGLYFSVILTIQPSTSFQPFWLTAASSIGLCNALHTLGLQPAIKWPNDILINGKKVAGVLTETIISNDKIISIIGIGCNIFNSLDDIFVSFPELKTQITTVEKELPIIKADFLGIILEQVFVALEEFLSYSNIDKISRIKKQWNNLSQLEGKYVRIKKIDSGEFISGRVSTITDSGSLIIQKISGEFEEFVSGDIKILS